MTLVTVIHPPQALQKLAWISTSYQDGRSLEGSRSATVGLTGVGLP